MTFSTSVPAYYIMVHRQLYISDSTTWHPPAVYSVRNVLGMLRKKTDEQNEKILVLEMLRKKTDEKNEKNTCSWNAQEKK